MFATTTCGKAITCSAGDFAAGEDGRILCYFPDDIDAHHSVFVQYYPFSAPTDASAKDVLLCKAEDVKTSTCKEQDGYVLKSHTRNTVMIEVVNITEKAAGRYNCQFLPPDRSPREMCNLTVRAKTAGVTPAREGDRDSDELDERQNSSTQTVHPGETRTVSLHILIVEVTVTFLMIAAAACIVIVMLKCHLNRHTEKDRYLPEADPLTGTKQVEKISGKVETLATQDSATPVLIRTVEKQSIQTQVDVFVEPQRTT